MIDINCDMGESFGAYIIGNDEAIFPYISSCNIACGGHAGDPLHIDRTLRLAVKYGVRIGAHPGFPDLQGFGRRPLQMSAEELDASIRYQVSALKGMAESVGGKIWYVKPHGALYNMASKDPEICHIVVHAIASLEIKLALMGLAGSHMGDIAHEQGLDYIAEAFADRAYESNGLLRSRALEGAVLSDPVKAAEQVVSISVDGMVKTYDGSDLEIRADSFCIHGDNPAAIPILKEIERQLSLNKIPKVSWK